MPLPDMKAALARAKAARQSSDSTGQLKPVDAEAVNRELGGGSAAVNGAHEPHEERRIVPMQPRRGPLMQQVGQDIDRTLPHSVEAEQGVLGSMIMSPREVVPLLQQKINAAFFYVPAHQTIYNDGCDLFADQGLFDLVTLTQYLRDLGHLDAVGGASFVTSLFTFVPTAANVSYYLEIVAEKYALRQLIAMATEAVRRGYEEQDDVADLIKAFQEKMGDLSILKARTRLPALRDLSQMLGTNKPERPMELVQGVLHQGSKLIVGGTSKGRKTYSLLDLAISVATGKQWWGFDCKQGPVCYINFEIQEAFFCDRVETICKAKGVTLPTDQLVGWNLRGHGEGIENLMQELLSELLRRRFVLIIFDPIYKALGDRDENKAGDVASMLNELEKIAVQTGAAIGFGAHYSKGNQAAKEAVDRIGGSGVFARDPDSILTMTPHEEEDAFTVDMTLRNFRPHKPFVVKWRGNVQPDYFPIFERDTELDPEALKQQRKANTNGQFAAKYSKDDLLSQLEIVAGIRPTELKKRMEEFNGMPKSTFYRLAHQLHKEGLMTELEGKWYRATKKQKEDSEKLA